MGCSGDAFIRATNGPGRNRQHAQTADVASCVTGWNACDRQHRRQHRAVFRADRVAKSMVAADRALYAAKTTGRGLRGHGFRR
jgi:hypothetical protein